MTEFMLQIIHRNGAGAVPSFRRLVNCLIFPCGLKIGNLFW